MVIGIYGAGGSGKNVLDTVNQFNKRGVYWDEVIFIDDVIGEEEFYGVKVLTFAQVREQLTPDEIEIVISLGEPHNRKIVCERVKAAGYRLKTVVHPEADVAESVILGDGVIVGKAFIGGSIEIKENVFVSQNAVIGHDTQIGPHGVVSANAFIAGHVVIGEQVYVGPCASMRDRLTIGDRSVIALSAAVFKDIPADYMAIGNPARMLKRTESDKLFG